MTNLIGRTLGAYEILEEIGQGGMANVYRAVQPSVGRTVAIKVLPSHFLQDRTFIERFTREAKIVANLQHPHILPVHDFGEDAGVPYIVMAYMPGGSLADHIGEGMPLDQIVRIVEQIADALDYAHGKGIIHRDFKPSNVLLDERGNLYLADFGIAKVAEMTASLTGGGLIGTPTYMAPEMSQPGGVSPLIDVYALGVSLYQMLAGHTPFYGDTPISTMMAHVTASIPKIAEVRPDLPKGVQRVLNKALAKDPMQRYQNAGELAADLRRAASEPAPKRPKPAAEVPKRPKPVKEARTVDIELEATRTTAPPHKLPMGIGAGVIGITLIGALIIGVILLNGNQGGAITSATPSAESPSITPNTGDAALLGATATENPVAETPTPLVTSAPTAVGGGSGEIAFAADAGDGNGLDIYIMNLDGSNLRRLTTEPGEDFAPDWSIDGKRVAYISDRFNGVNNVFLGDANGTFEVRLTNAQGGYVINDAATVDVSLSGSLILYNALQTNFQAVMLVSNDAIERSPLTFPSEGNNFNPRWSPDGARILVSSNRDTSAFGEKDIYTMDTQGRDIIRLTEDSFDDIEPVWSPDGSRIAFSSKRDSASYGIYVMNADGSNITLLTDDGKSPKWSLDGTKILFVSSRDGSPQIYIMDADGSNVTAITSTLSLTNFSSPDWRPVTPAPTE